MELEEKVDKLIDEVGDINADVAAVKSALKYNGQGLIPAFEKHCDDFNKHCDHDREFRQDYYKFRRWAIGIFCFMVGSGVISLSAVKIVSMIAGG